ncbi:MAG: ABC-F family ATP-binding cassette domain-containing protein [Candidatus Omnitrophica bacterium]|nr:ABC-F family ATP-binding cassette domain-containing protein [Candidatus Omnitrophota bacterium]
MITLTNVSKNFDTRMLMDQVSLSIFPNERIGLTGPNGAGKTTLFHLILGDLEPSSGTISIQKGIKIGYLPQEAHFDSKRTVMEEVTSGDEEIQRLSDEKHRMESEDRCAETRYGDILEKLEALGIYELEHRAEKILAGLGFREHEFHKPIMQLSGGWQMRTLLARLLTYHYDLLLLDEPTNYLDLAATLWLKDFLSTYPGSFIMISHDKIFLNDVTNYTIVLESGRMAKVKGNYETYEEQKEIEYRTLEKQQKVLDKRKDQLERFTSRFHAQPNRASAVQNKMKMIERIEEQSVELPRSRASIKDFSFPQTTESGYTVITLDQIKKSYSDKVIYDGLNFEITKGQKVCLVGPNGAGKSTLLKILADVIPFDGGTRRLGHGVKMGYFSQTRLDVLNPNRTALEELLSAVGGAFPQTQARNLLGIFNYHGDDVFKPVSVLSGGEKSRLILAKHIINPPNFLLLDEPTTHLDVAGVEALTRAFQNYAGTLCFISHDLFFIKQIANHIVEVDNGTIRQYPGGLDYYLDKKQCRGAAEDEASRKAAARKAFEDDRKAKKARENEPENLRQAREKHEAALGRCKEIKNELKSLEREEKELETETYIKSRVLNTSFSGRDRSQMAENGRRLKEIQIRLREIESTRKRLIAERDQINQG